MIDRPDRDSAAGARRCGQGDGDGKDEKHLPFFSPSRWMRWGKFHGWEY
jgi:hypothetical protein